ncbi:hypothetical protein CMV_011838 [Castanea mollissima]|uniref:Uncharacterized protein n=1 Tax=Castanea mollissima TaxID=60419 RepID=A0A8J4RC68_9ROSI|nr:hypothetical protein CMV_011838 [Castanea mollissima]
MTSLVATEARVSAMDAKENPWCTAVCIVPSPIKNSFLLELCRSYDDKTRKWMCTDIEVQRYVVRSIAAFLDSISGDTLHHPLVKDVPSVQQSLRFNNLHLSKNHQLHPITKEAYRFYLGV